MSRCEYVKGTRISGVFLTPGLLTNRLLTKLLTTPPALEWLEITSLEAVEIRWGFVPRMHHMGTSPPGCPTAAATSDTCAGLSTASASRTPPGSASLLLGADWGLSA